MNLVYTAIYGGYDKLWQPKVVSEGWEYKCYTDVKIEGGHWQIIGKKLPDVDSARASKYVKILHPMENYENILWVDGCIEITGDLNEFIKGVPAGELVIARHPFNNTLKEELDACIRMNKDDHEVMRKQVEGYGEFPIYEHTQNTVILKRKNLKASEIWWEEVRTKSKRDQLSFGWAMQQANQEYSTYTWTYAEKFFTWHKFHDK